VLGPLLALAASLSGGIGDFLAGHASRRLRLLTVLAVSRAAGLASIAGVVLASRDAGAIGRGRGVARGVGLALVAAVSFGLLLVALGAASERDALWATLAMRTTSFGVLAAAAVVLRASLSPDRSDMPALVAVGLLDTAGNTLFALASTESLLSVAAVLAQVFPVVTVILARVALGERIARWQQVGVTGALIGVTLITVG
jgi:drug/metabolite transporter (DMT)-like permease